MRAARPRSYRRPMTDHHPALRSAPASPPPTPARRPLGLPLLSIIGLALLAAPRVVLHDLGIIDEGTAINALFVVIPPIAWIAVTLAASVPRPILTLIAIGACYGVLLALGHQLLWGVSFADGPPRLGGNLSGLDPAAQSAILRTVAVLSSLITGTVVGAICGLVAWVLRGVARQTRRSRGGQQR
jgi:hypothetical protein